MPVADLTAGYCLIVCVFERTFEFYEFTATNLIIIVLLLSEVPLRIKCKIRHLQLSLISGAVDILS